MTTCAIPEFALRYAEVIRFIREAKTFPCVLIATFQ
jgi:hypothetical protein